MKFNSEQYEARNQEYAISRKKDLEEAFKNLDPDVIRLFSEIGQKCCELNNRGYSVFFQMSNFDNIQDSFYHCFIQKPYDKTKLRTEEEIEGARKYYWTHLTLFSNLLAQLGIHINQIIDTEKDGRLKQYIKNPALLPTREDMGNMGDKSGPLPR